MSTDKVRVFYIHLDNGDRFEFGADSKELAIDHVRYGLVNDPSFTELTSFKMPMFDRWDTEVSMV